MLDIIVNAPCPQVSAQASPLPCFGDFLIHSLRALGYPLNALPYAALLAKKKGLSGSYVMVSLVHWQASHNDAMILGVGNELGLDSKQLRIWFEELKPLLNDSGSELFDADFGHWLLSLGEKEHLCAEPPSALRHQSLMPAIAALGCSGAWQKLLTEAQMYLHAHPLNSRSKPLQANGLWFWGGGVLTDTPLHSRPLFSDSALLQEVLGAQKLESFFVKLSEDAVLLIENPDKTSLKTVQLLCKKYKTQWYWQDTSYALPIQSWWMRILNRSRKCE